MFDVTCMMQQDKTGCLVLLNATRQDCKTKQTRLQDRQDCKTDQIGRQTEDRQDRKTDKTARQTR